MEGYDKNAFQEVILNNVNGMKELNKDNEAFLSLVENMEKKFKTLINNICRNELSQYKSFFNKDGELLLKISQTKYEKSQIDLNECINKQGIDLSNSIDKIKKDEDKIVGHYQVCLTKCTTNINDCYSNCFNEYFTNYKEFYKTSTNTLLEFDKKLF